MLSTLPNLFIDVARRALARCVTRQARSASGWPNRTPEASHDGPATPSIKTVQPATRPHVLEAICMEAFLAQGWKVKTVKAVPVGSGAAAGMSLFIARKRGQRLAVHCRRTDTVVDENAILAIFDATALHDSDQTLVFSEGRYTAMAHQLSRAVGVRLLRAADLLDLDQTLAREHERI